LRPLAATEPVADTETVHASGALLTDTGPLKPAAEATAKPFLKWAGGKKQLLPELMKWLPQEFRAYHEPFLGGGAVFFALASRGLLARANLSDVNEALIQAYEGVRDHVEKVIERLEKHVNKKEHYLRVRAQNPRRLSPVGRAARIIYLNKTCYNGLYRENRSGKFNVPFGKYRNPNICDKENLRAVAQLLRRAEISCRSYRTVLEKARKGDFVYFDPPYDPLTKTARFTEYDQNRFTRDDQTELRDTFLELDRRGVYVMLSNSDTPFVRQLYEGFGREQVFASRAINSNPDRRGKVSELVIRNYD